MANLLTLDEYKDYEGLSSTKEDTKLELLVNSVSQLVKTYCGNSIVDYYYSDKVEEFSMRWASNVVQLTESPLVSVTSIQSRTSETAEYTTLAATDYHVDVSTDSVFRVKKDWEQGFGSVKVTYKAGYPSTPADLKLALVDLVRFYYKNEYKERQSLSGASVDNPSSNSSANVAFPDHIKRVLDLYKNY